MASETPYKVVQVPTALGIVTGWHTGRVIAEFKDKEAADECAYLTFADEPAPDKADYYSIEVVRYEP